MMARESSRHSGLLATKSRSRQMSARTAPAGRPPEFSRDVPGRGQMGDAWFVCAGPVVLGLRGARLARGWGDQGGRCRRLADGAADQPGLERGGAKQAAGDAGEDFSDFAGAEVPRGVVEVGRGGALLQRGGQVPAVVDQRADEGEEAEGAGGCVRAGGRPVLVGIGAVGWAGGGGRVGHGRGRTRLEGMCQGIFSSKGSGNAERVCSGHRLGRMAEGVRQGDLALRLDGWFDPRCSLRPSDIGRCWPTGDWQVCELASREPAVR